MIQEAESLRRLSIYFKHYHMAVVCSASAADCEHFCSTVILRLCLGLLKLNRILKETPRMWRKELSEISGWFVPLFFVLLGFKFQVFLQLHLKHKMHKCPANMLMKSILCILDIAKKK